MSSWNGHVNGACGNPNIGSPGRELAFESKRLFDLKRWGLFYEGLKEDRVAKIGIGHHHIFLPIPLREPDLAPSLGQNPGY